MKKMSMKKMESSKKDMASDKKMMAKGGGMTKAKKKC